MLLYDNLEDVKTKLVGTFCYHKGKAVYIKEAVQCDDDIFKVCCLPLHARNKVWVSIDDPDLNFMRFNVGYTNHGMASVWWYRIPHRQYRQGLRHDQMNCRASQAGFKNYVEFAWSSPVVEMMENSYPKFENIEKPLMDGESVALAFHQDFAATWDKVHKDLIIEYKGRQIGCFNKDFNLLDEYKHLTEALKEAVA